MNVRSTLRTEVTFKHLERTNILRNTKSRIQGYANILTFFLVSFSHCQNYTACLYFRKINRDS